MGEPEIKSVVESDVVGVPVGSTSSVPAVQVVSNILKPTLQDNDFLQSFVRIGLDESSSPDSRHATFADEKSLKRYLERKKWSISKKFFNFHKEKKR